MRPLSFPWLTLAAVLWLCACVHTTPATLPEGFAAYPPDDAFKAVSPDGVVYRVRSEPNKPYAEMAFWKEAMKKRMLEAGYRLSAEAPLPAGPRQGYLLELTAPYGPLDYGYMIAIFVEKESIQIAEAAGEVVALAKHRPELLKAMTNLTAQ
ncbi:MAG: hypothetical protein HZB87_04225 [Desulfatitalea sp.]|nr:hypothetical protein [Desulfatitalea sp.]MBI5896195.1 hypothetical protein [Desulfobacterales bacterium]